MSRTEFTQVTKRKAAARCKDAAGTMRCEGKWGAGDRCRRSLTCGNSPEYDHIIECWEGGDNSLENCRVLGRKCCHRPKTTRKSGERARNNKARKAQDGIRPRSTFGNSRDGKYKTRLTARGPVTGLR